MTDIIDGNGLTIDNLNTRVTELTADYQDIYGVDIIVSSNSPDSQAINIHAQRNQDNAELAEAVYNSFDPDQAVGVVLDQRCAINNIQRKIGTFTTQVLDITTDRALTLDGLDATASPFTVEDDTGNQFYLTTTTNFITAGTLSLPFRAANLGATLTLPNTITEIVTVIIGVISSNNPADATLIGTDEETDVAFRERRRISISNAATGSVDGILGSINNLSDVESALVYENKTATTDINSIPPHSIWAIVEGGINDDIANIIYSKLSFGADTKGSVLTNITTASGQIIPIKFDRTIVKDLHIRFDIQPTITALFDELVIKTYIANNLSYLIAEDAETSRIVTLAVTAINEAGGGGVPLNVEISKDGATWADFIAVDLLNERWNPDVSRITITVLP